VPTPHRSWCLTARGSAPSIHRATSARLLVLGFLHKEDEVNPVCVLLRAIEACTHKLCPI
jgi:hypothetical protein